MASEQTTCAAEPDEDAEGEPNKDATQRLTATSPEGLSNGSLSVQYANGGSISNPGGAGDALASARSDAAFGAPGCKEKRAGRRLVAEGAVSV